MIVLCLQDVYLYMLEETVGGNPWQFMAVFSSQSAAEKELLSSHSSTRLKHLDEYRLFKVECDDRLWGNRTPVPWSAHMSNG